MENNPLEFRHNILWDFLNDKKGYGNHICRLDITGKQLGTLNLINLDD